MLDHEVPVRAGTVRVREMNRDEPGDVITAVPFQVRRPAAGGS